MKQTLAEFAGSKRFFLVTFCVVVLAVFVITGKMPLQGDETHMGFFQAFTTLSGLLATLYGVENVAQAIRAPSSPPDPPPAPETK